MGRVSVFNNVSLDGFFVDMNGDMSWAHARPDDAEWHAFVAQNASGGADGGGALVLGRVTYETMASFWPTPTARELMPEVAEGMNRRPKIVFSRTLGEAAWDNTKLPLKLTGSRRNPRSSSPPTITTDTRGSRAPG